MSIIELKKLFHLIELILLVSKNNAYKILAN